MRVSPGRLVLLVVVPLLSLLRRRAEVETRANDPENKKGPNNGTNDDSGNCATAQCCSIVAAIAGRDDCDGLCVLSGYQGRRE